MGLLSATSRFKDSGGDESKMLRWIMSLAYRIVFECPLGRHNINLQKRCRNVSLSEDEAMRIFGDEDVVLPSKTGHLIWVESGPPKQEATWVGNHA
jgi:hypothetical protein